MHRLEAAGLRQGDIHDDNIWIEAAEERVRGDSISGFSYYHYLSLSLEKTPVTLPDHGMIVDEQNGDAALSLRH
jgi:hypothetical protein